MRKETQVPGSISENELNRLVDAYSGMLLGLCRLTLGDLAMAQDIVQETFLRAWQKGGFRPETEKAWLIRTAIRICIDESRKSRRYANVPLNEEITAPGLPGNSGVISGCSFSGSETLLPATGIS